MGGMVQWFSLKEAEKAILEHCEGVVAMDGVVNFSSMDMTEEEKAARVAVGRNIALRGGCPVLDLDVWQVLPLPPPPPPASPCASSTTCKNPSPV